MATAEEKAREVRELGSTIRDFLNRRWADGTDALVADMLTAHRTLQAMFTQFCLRWLYLLAEEGYYDQRNARAVEAAREVKRLLGEGGWRVA